MSRNVVLLILDTVRKDCFDEYADRIKARSGVSFERCRAAGTWSVPSHASIFTGKLPHEHHVHGESFGADFDFEDAIGEGSVTTSLDDHRSIGVSSNIYVNDVFGFDGLFDEFYDHSIGTHRASVLFPTAFSNFQSAKDIESSLRRYGHLLKKALTHDEPAKSVANGLWTAIGLAGGLERLPVPKLTDDGAKANSVRATDRARNCSSPFFVFVNYMDAHNPHQNTRGYDQTLHSVSNRWSSSEYDRLTLLTGEQTGDRFARNYRALYRASIEYLDRVVSSMIDELLSIGDRETTVVVTADHGHNLGYESEGGQFHHTTSMSEGVMHVPLEVVNPPDGAPKSVDRLVSQTDLFELLQAIVEDRWPDDLGDDWIGAEHVGQLGVDPNPQWPDRWFRMIRCAYHGDTKYEWDSMGNRDRYDLATGTPNTQILVDQDCEIPDEALSLFGSPLTAYKSRWERASQDGAFDSKTERQLRDLGYL